MKAVVTGGSGFIGSHLVHELTKQGEHVSSFDIEPYQASGHPMARGTEIVGDVRSYTDIALAAEGADVVFHLAALTSVPISWSDPSDTIETNEAGTVNVLRACAEQNVSRLVFASSAAVYGPAPEVPTSETHPIRPVNPYGLTKASAEQHLALLGETYGIEVVVLRFFNVFGPGQDVTSPYASVIPRFISAALTAAPITIFGDGHQTRDFVYVDDVVDALMAAGSRSDVAGATVNVGTGVERSINDVVRAVTDLLGSEIAVDRQPVRLGDPRRSRADIQLATQIFDYRPAMAFEEGLKLVVDWWRERIDGGFWTPPTAS